MTSFKRDVMAAASKRAVLTNQVIRWSEQLRKAMGLSAADVKDALRDGIHWQVGQWVIYPEHRAYEGWHNILEVVPVDVFKATGGRSVGWSNVAHYRLPSSWTARLAGTTTAILPSEADRDRILNAIRTREPACDEPDHEDRSLRSAIIRRLESFLPDSSS